MSGRVRLARGASRLSTLDPAPPSLRSAHCTRVDALVPVRSRAQNLSVGSTRYCMSNGHARARPPAPSRPRPVTNFLPQ